MLIKKEMNADDNINCKENTLQNESPKKDDELRENDLKTTTENIKSNEVEDKEFVDKKKKRKLSVKVKVNVNVKVELQDTENDENKEKGIKKEKK